ncbi:MAG: replicative DNA helicase [Firmicutes bacterium]|nr:replicative DNA helicase [Bacillota bacterium]
MWDKVPPHNIDAEQSVLGALLLDNTAISKVVRHIHPEDFYMDSHRVIFETILDLEENGKAADLVTVTDSMRRQGELEKVGGTSYVATLANIAPTAANAEFYARIVEEKALLRNLIKLATRIAGMGYEGGEDAERLMEEAEKMLMELGSRRTSTVFTELKDILKDTFKHLEYLHKHKGEITGVPTGFTDLDRICQGLQPSDLVIVAARPSMGKTSFGLCIAYQAAVRTGKPVALFSLEMSKEQLVQRMLCAEARVDQHKLRSGFIGEQDWLKLTQQAREMAQLPIFIDDSGVLTARQIRAKSRQIHMEKGLGLVVIDYLQLMQGGRRVENRQQEIAEISRSLKSLAKELNVPVLALAQLSRSVEQRQDKKPIMSDLRESGCLAGDSLVQLANGKRLFIKDLVGLNNSEKVMALNETTWKLEPAVIRKAWCTGTKQVFKLVTESGRNVKATANHKFRTVEGWKRLDQLKVSEHIALPRSWEGLNLSEATMTDSEVSYCGSTLYKCNLSRKRAALVGQVIKDESLSRLSSSDVYWDRISSIKLDGVEHVYDLEVPGYHNFIADDIVVHNSLEQDADVVMFIYRDEYYNPDTEKTGIAEIIVAKQRSGPTGTVELAFLKEFTRFMNLARRNEGETVPEPEA